VSTVLVVEDNHAIARSLTDALKKAECNVIGPIGTLAEATRIASEVSVDAVLMDVDLGGERVYPLARELRDRKIPFALLTGFGAEDLPPDLREGAIFPKPIDLEAVFNWLRIDPTS
jgi:DNA-binding response OmpR family regulator